MRWLFLAVTLLLLSAGPVAAHASLVESEPPEGGTIEATPATLSATFDEPLDAARSRIVVRDASGEEVARGGVADDPMSMSVALPALPAGEYAARWTAVTPDDQGVTRGTISFTIAPEAAPPPTPERPLTPAPEATPATTTQPTAPPPVESPAEPPPAAATPQPTPAPTPADDAPAAGTSDLLIALLVAGVVVAGIAIYLLRR